MGERLGVIERACLRSIVRQGHPLTLWTYDPVQGVPDEVELGDASAVVPRERIVRHHTGSVALFSNLFRYELMRRGAGIWVDADIYAVRPLEFPAGHVFGLEERGVLNSAVLRLPPDSPMLTPLLDMFEERYVPFWLSMEERVAGWERFHQTGRVGLSEMPWGTAGPLALTALAQRERLIRQAQAVEVFYPVHYDEADWLLDPARPLESVVQPETRAIHLWNEVIKGFKDAPAPPGSFLAQLQAEGSDTIAVPRQTQTGR